MNYLLNTEFESLIKITEYTLEEYIDNELINNFKIEILKLKFLKNRILYSSEELDLDKTIKSILHNFKKLEKKNSIKNSDCSYGYFSQDNDSPYKIKSIPNFINNYDEELKIELFKKIEFDSFIYTKKNTLCKIVYLLFLKIFNLDELNINAICFQSFIKEVSEHYHNNPYHNFNHAVSVLQFTYMLIIETNISKYISKHKLFGLMVASLVHDIDHPGHTNNFEININSELAQKYKYKSVLENHHCSMSYYIMHKQHILLLNNLSIDQFIDVKETISECILTTDMKYHENLVSKLNNEFNNKSINDIHFTNDIQIMICKLIIHTADLSNTMRPFEISKKVAFKINDEFKNQAFIEEKLNLPTLDFMKIPDNKTLYKNELMFGLYIIKPLLDIFLKIYPNIKYIQNEFDKNTLNWRMLLEKE